MADGRMGARAGLCWPLPFGKPMLGEECGSGVVCVTPSSARLLKTLCRLGVALQTPFPGATPYTLRPGRLGPSLLGQCLGTTSVALGPGLVGPFPSASHTTHANK